MKRAEDQQDEVYREVEYAARRDPFHFHAGCVVEGSADRVEYNDLRSEKKVTCHGIPRHLSVALMNSANVGCLDSR